MPNLKISQFPINTNPSGENLLAVVASGVTMALPLSGVSTFISLSGDLNNVVSKNVNYNIFPSETNTHFTNEGATTGITFSLPAAVKNMKYSFLLQNSNQVTVQAATGDTIRIGLDVTSSGGTISAFDAGSSITLIAINSTEWLSLSQPAGSWLI